MKRNQLMNLLAVAALAPGFAANAADSIAPIAAPDLVFNEVDGIVAVEAEHFHKQTLTDKRAWHITSSKSAPDLKPDHDPPHVAGASRGAYLEILPDTRVTHGHKLIKGENFTDDPGQLAVVHYKVNINTAGRYYVWVRSFSTGSEDNGVHVGMNGQWPESGQRWQTVQKNKWSWDCKQRTPQVHTGVPMQLFLDIEKPGEHEIMFSMREDGFEMDKFVLAANKEFKPEGKGPVVKIKSGKLPAPFPEVVGVVIPAAAAAITIAAAEDVPLRMEATGFALEGTGYYLDKGKWLAINPNQQKSATAKQPFPFPSGRYDVTLEAVGEEDGKSTYTVSVGDREIGQHACPIAPTAMEEGAKYHQTWKNQEVDTGDIIAVGSTIASANGKDHSRARWSRITFTPADHATKEAAAKVRPTLKTVAIASDPKPAIPQELLVMPRSADGNGTVEISGDLKEWHKVTLTLDGPYAHERDNEPNPFTDLALTVRFTHESGAPSYTIPGYFAADGNAGESSAESGTKWRAHLSPDKAGLWNYAVSFTRGKHAALDGGGAAVEPFDGVCGSFEISKTDKHGRDFRAHGRLQYVGKHHLQFAGSKNYFLKAGPDAPETLMAFADFDNTQATRKNAPLKTWEPHLKDWRQGDPTWKNGKGKGLIGALNYLAGKGCNAFSFLTYNVDGDGDNIWPFVARRAKFHYDCSKLDQWGIVFDHATSLGLHCHFKLQETENDDHRDKEQREVKFVEAALDGGQTGPERKLYLREIIARYGHLLALNWNLGEENTQTAEEQRAMADYIAKTDTYQHHRVIHTYPGQQDKVYKPLLGDQSKLTGASLQNNWDLAHKRTLHWLKESAAAGKPWVCANDEQGGADTGAPPDLGYKGYDGKVGGKVIQTPDDIRKHTLWGNLMAGGAGVEYYFGYKLLENDLNCEDFRSRDKSWDSCRIALDFFRENQIPFHEMSNANALIGNMKDDNSKYCFAKKGEVYLVYLPKGGATPIDLSAASGKFSIKWFNPREGGEPKVHGNTSLEGGGKGTLSAPSTADWLAVIMKE